MANLPLSNIKVVEFAGIGPGPMAAMVLADFGADVIRIDKPGDSSIDIASRGKRSVALSLKSQQGLAAVKDIVSKADVIIDPYRPGVLEKFGLGPKDAAKLTNDRIIYARMTGFRRTGPFSSMAGHDINYIALSGVLSMIRSEKGKPVFPLNILGDFAGGGMICVQGILLAVIERNRTGRGQVVEANMQEGARYVSAMPLILQQPSTNTQMWNKPVGDNILDGGCPWYGVYETKDAKFMTVGAIEPRFYKIFIATLSKELDRDGFHHRPYPIIDDQYNRNTWPALRRFFENAFLQRTRSEWTKVFLGTDSCVAPVLEPYEVGEKGDESARGATGFGNTVSPNSDGGLPNPAPHLSRTPGKTPIVANVRAGQHSREILKEIGYNDAKISQALQEKSTL